jgi:ankyrin repeat protein
VEGTAGDWGCKFLLQNTSGVITCCFSPEGRENLCVKGDQGVSCREEADYTVMTEADRCVLFLPDFKVSDAGTYRAVFPDCLTCNRNVEVVARTGVGWTPVVVTFLLLILIVVGIVVYVYVWKPRRSRERDEEKDIHNNIVEALRAENSVEFNKLLDGRSVRNIFDDELNSIFHLAARSDWNTQMTEIVYAILPKHKETDLEATPLSESKRASIYRVTSRVTRAHSSLLNSQNSKGETPLMIASAENQMEVVNVLLEQDVDLEIKDHEGENALQHAVRNGNVEVVEELLEKYGDSWREYGMSLVYLSVAGKMKDSLDREKDIEKKRRRTLELLLQHKANSDGSWTLVDGRTCIQRAVEENNSDAIRLLKEKMGDALYKLHASRAIKQRTKDKV